MIFLAIVPTCSPWFAPGEVGDEDSGTGVVPPFSWVEVTGDWVEVTGDAEDTAAGAATPPERRRATVSEEVANFVFNGVDMRAFRVGYWGGVDSGEVLSVGGYLPKAPIMKTNVTVTRSAIPIAMIQFSGVDKSVRSRKMFIEISAVTMPITEVMGTSLVMDTLPCLMLEESWADACFPVPRLHVEV